MSRIISSSEIEQASVLIKCGTEQGTGFFIDKGIIMTARHVVIDNIEEKELININGKDYDSSAILAEILEFDVCLLKVGETCKVVLPVNNTSQSFNQPCNVFGFPYKQDKSGNHFSGRIDKLGSRIHWDFSAKYDGVEEDIDFGGLSGGAIVSEGQVIGVALIQEGKSIRAISIRKIESFISKNGIEVTQYAGPSEIPIQLKEEVDKATLNYSVFEELTNKLKNGSGWFLTYGVPGSGKTTFIASYSPKEDTVKVCGRYFSKIPNDNLSTSIRSSDRHFITWIEDSVSSALGISIDVLTKFEDRVKRIPSLLESIQHKMPNTHCLFLIDGLDEIDNLKSFLNLLPVELPPNVSFVLSCTSIDILPSNIKSGLGPESIIEVTPLDIGQCEVYLSERLQDKKIGISAIQSIARKSEGHPLYLQYLLKYILTYDVQGEKLDEWIKEIPVIGGEISTYYEVLWTKFFSDECKLWIVLTLSQLRTSIDQAALIAMLPEQYRLSFISKYNPIRYLIKGGDNIELYHNSFKNFISYKADSYVSFANSCILEFCNSSPEHRYAIENHLFHMVLSNPDQSLEHCNQEWADKCALHYVSPDLIISDIKRVISHAVDSTKPTEVVELLLLLQRIEFRYDSVFADNATSIAAALVALGEYSSALNYLLRDNTLLISDGDLIFFLQAFYENEAIEEGDRLLEAFNTRYRHYLQVEFGKSRESFSMDPFIHKVSAHTLSVKSIGKDGILHAMSVLSSLKRFQDAAKKDGDESASEGFYHIREIAAAWHYGYMLRAYDAFYGSKETAELTEIELDEKWARMRALSILQYGELNTYASGQVEKSVAYFNTIQDIEWLIENIGYDNKEDTILILVKSLINDSKRIDMVENLIKKYQVNGSSSLISLRDENGVDLNHFAVHTHYFDCVIDGYITSAYSLNLPDFSLRRNNWEKYYIDLLEQIGKLEGVLIKSKLTDGDLTALYGSLKQLLNSMNLGLAERSSWERSYLLPEDIIPILYDKLSSLWCYYFDSSIDFFVKYVSEKSDLQLGVYTEGFRTSLSFVIQNMIKWNIPTRETRIIIKLLENHILLHVQNRWERTPELLSLVEYYALQGLSDDADLIFKEMLKTSMGPSWYKEAQLQLLNTTLRLNGNVEHTQQYIPKFASLLDCAAGEMTFQRYIRYDKESFIGDIISMRKLDIGIEYLKFETVPPFKALNENAEYNKVDSLALGYGNTQGARNIAIQSGVLEILRNCEGLNPFIKVALCNIFTLNDDIFRYVDYFSKQMAIAVNELGDKGHREEVYPLIAELIESGKMEEDRGKYIHNLRSNLDPAYYNEFCDYFNSHSTQGKLEKSEEEEPSEPAAGGSAREDVFQPVNKRFEEELNESNKKELVELALDAFNKEKISIWYSNWSTSSKQLKKNLKEVFTTAEEAISILSDSIVNYGVDTWTVVDKLLWFFEHISTEDQVQSIFESISNHFELLIRPNEFVLEKYDWINSHRDEKTTSEQIIALIAWLTTHPLEWINVKAQSNLVFLSKKMPEVVVPVLIEETALNEPTKKGEHCCNVLLELTKESPEVMNKQLNDKPELIDKIAAIPHLTIFKTYWDIGQILLKNGFGNLDAKLQSILPDVIEGNSEVALEESKLESIQDQIDQLNMIKILNRRFCEDILKLVPEYCVPLTWKEVVKSDDYLKRSYHEEKNYKGRYPELVKYALNQALMTRVGKNNLDELSRAINLN